MGQFALRARQDIGCKMARYSTVTRERALQQEREIGVGLGGAGHAIPEASDQGWPPQVPLTHAQAACVPGAAIRRLAAMNSRNGRRHAGRKFLNDTILGPLVNTGPNAAGRSVHR